MIGLDTNVVLRYLLQDDPTQLRQTNRIFEQQLSEASPGFLNLTTTLEVVWALRSVLKRTPAEIAAHLEGILSRDALAVQNAEQVYEAAFALKRGSAEFEDALIGSLNAWAGCASTVTFDRKAARLPHFRLIV
jgi:predicted nucleic-acid-binding protein